MELPDEKPVLEINCRSRIPGFTGSLFTGERDHRRMRSDIGWQGKCPNINVATGKQTFQIDHEEPVIYMDFDLSARYLVFTGMSQINVWDLAENRAVSIVPRNSARARGVFSWKTAMFFRRTPFRI